MAWCCLAGIEYKYKSDDDVYKWQEFTNLSQFIQDSLFQTFLFDKEAQECDGEIDFCDKGHGGPDSLSETIAKY